MRQPILLKRRRSVESVYLYNDARSWNRITLENAAKTDRRNAEALTLDSEYRFDPATGLWALIVEGRADRPSNTERYRSAEGSDTGHEHDSSCPFCLGNELETPEAVAVAALKHDLGEKDEYEVDDFEIVTSSPDTEVEGREWLTRVFENKYPAFRMNRKGEDESTFTSVEKRFFDDELPNPSFFNSISGRGRHEVIVDSPRHVRGWSDLSPLEVKLTFRMFHSRLHALRATGCFAYSFVFKNTGVTAGASQRHLHCQLTGNIELPPTIRDELERLIRYEQTRLARGEQLSYWDALLDAELRAKERIVAVTDRFVVYCPYASRVPMQTEICPRFNDPFEDYDEAALDELALLARRAVIALEEVKRRHYPDEPDPLDYNVVLKNAPTLLEPDISEYRGLMRPRWLILPSIIKRGGFELGCCIDINPVSPETSARMLRDTFPLVK